MSAAVTHPLHQPAGDAFVALGKASGPMAFIGATLAGVPLQAWACLLGMAYTLVLLAHLIWKWRREARGVGKSED